MASYYGDWWVPKKMGKKRRQINKLRFPLSRYDTLTFQQCWLFGKVHNSITTILFLELWQTWPSIMDQRLSFESWNIPISLSSDCIGRGAMALECGDRCGDKITGTRRSPDHRNTPEPGTDGCVWREVAARGRQSGLCGAEQWGGRRGFNRQLTSFFPDQLSLIWEQITFGAHGWGTGNYIINSYLRTESIYGNEIS
jgi:hypothetical protein